MSFPSHSITNIYCIVAPTCGYSLFCSLCRVLPFQGKCYGHQLLTYLFFSQVAYSRFGDTSVSDFHKQDMLQLLVQKMTVSFNEQLHLHKCSFTGIQLLDHLTSNQITICLDYQVNIDACALDQI